MNSTDLSNPYQELGVSENSSHEEIKRAYQRLVLKVWKLIVCVNYWQGLFWQARSDQLIFLRLSFKVHPDKLDESLSQEDRDKAYKRFLAIDKAWKILNNQETRADCDRQLKGVMNKDTIKQGRMNGNNQTWKKPNNNINNNNNNNNIVYIWVDID